MSNQDRQIRPDPASIFDTLPRFPVSKAIPDVQTCKSCTTLETECVHASMHVCEFSLIKTGKQEV